jgi:hypothetical protein
MERHSAVTVLTLSLNDTLEGKDNKRDEWCELEHGEYA